MTQLTKDQDTLARVTDALVRGGYSADGILSARFAGHTTGWQEVHTITFNDPDAENGVNVGSVYVWANDVGELVADF